MALELRDTGPGRGRNSSSSPPLSVSPSSPRTLSPSTLPPWSRTAPDHRPSPFARHGRRTSSRFGGAGSARGSGPRRQAAALLRDAYRTYTTWSESLVNAFLRLPPSQRALAVLACVAAWVVLVLVLVYSHRFFAWLAPVAKAWRQQPGGWLLIFVLICATAFPPLVGYSTATTIAGFIYGFPAGWPLAATACVVGSLGAFLACRNFFSARVDRLVGSDHRFVALGQVLRRDGIWYLTGIRFCPLPFSLSNGFLATIPSITPLSFALSTALSSPKLLVHVFIGSRLAALAEDGDSMSAGDKAINYLSMFIGASVGLIVGLVIYRRTIARAEQLAAESAGTAVAGDDDDDDEAAAERGEAGYQDSDATLLDPEDAAAVMLDDELALWDTDAQTDPYVDDDPKINRPFKGRSGSGSGF